MDSSGSFTAAAALIFLLVATGDQDAGCGGDPVRHALDALPHPGGGQLLPGQGLPGQLVPALLPDLHLPQQRHQPGHLQRHVSKVSRCFPQDLPLREERLRQTRHLQCGTHLQRSQGYVDGGEH